MMASPLAASVAALVALAFFTLVGLPLARRVFGVRGLALAVAPTLGWAVFSAAALPVLCLIGFGAAMVFALATAAAAFSFYGLTQARAAPGSPDLDAPDLGPPALAYLLAGLLAAASAIALLPKETVDGVLLAAPIFDHSKVAIVDEIARNGVPAQNPFYGEAGGGAGLSYYYLWHFSAAMLSLLPGVSGWEADVALTWFTAFATLSLVMGLAVRIAGRRSAAVWALVLSAAGSARPLISSIFGQDAFGTWLSDYPDLGTELVQATWAPQHVAAAGCVIVAVLLMLRIADGAGRPAAVTLGLVAAAGFGASVWVGGFVFALAAASAGLFLIAKPDAGRGRFVLGALLAVAVAAIAASPILLEQARAAATRPEGLPIALHPVEVLGPRIAETGRRLLDLPAFWLVQLPVDLPAIYPAGMVALAAAAFSRALPARRRRLALVFGLAVAASLGVSWLLVSTVLNNDLGWRAILPGVLALTAFAGAGLARWTARPFRPGSLAALALVLAGLHGGVLFLTDDGAGRPSASAGAFARSPEIWRAARRHAGPADRVANAPDLFAGMTRWPINISWALLADRRSCYAGWEFVRPFAPLARAEVEALDRDFKAVFAGAAAPGLAGRLFARHVCTLAVVTPGDGAWSKGSFADDPAFELLEETDAWRIYRFAPKPGAGA